LEIYFSNNWLGDADILQQMAAWASTKEINDCMARATDISKSLPKGTCSYWGFGALGIHRTMQAGKSFW